MGILNSDGALGIAQAAWSTPLTPTLSIPITGGSYAYVRSDFESARVRSDLSPGEQRKGFYHYEVTLNTELTASGLDILHKYAFGGYAFAADTPVAGANTRTHTLADVAAELTTMYEKGFTLEVGSDDKWFTFDSCVVNSVTIDMPKPGMITAVWNILAEEKTEAASGETYAPSAVDIVYDNFQIVVSAGADASEVAQPIESFTMEFNRNAVPKFIASANAATRWIPGEKFSCTGSFQIAVAATERAAVNDDLLNSDEFSLLAVFTSDQMVTGSTPYSTSIDIPEAKYTGVEPGIEASERIETYSFALGRSGGSAPFTLTNVNGDATL
jgi:hypothetical protein